MQRRQCLGGLLAASLVSASRVRAREASCRLTIYTAVEPEWLAVYRDAFAVVRPDIEITYVRASAGPICARLLAERDHVRADAVLGVSAIAMENLRLKGILEPYRPHDAEKLNARMVERNWHWFGINAWGGSVCVNTALLEKRGLPVPRRWSDLLQSPFRGQIVMPNPKASSTGLMYLHGFVQGFGEVDGWNVIERLNRNVLFYAASGARPAAMTAQGEIPVGLSAAAFLKPFQKYKTPVAVVEPEEGIAWDAEACALPRSCPHPQEARAFLDFCAGPAVGRIAADFSGIAAHEGFSTEQGKRIAERFLPMDFARAAADKEKILARWHEMATR